MKIMQALKKPILVIGGSLLGLLIYGYVTMSHSNVDKYNSAMIWMQKAEVSIGDSERFNNEKWRTPRLHQALRAYDQAASLTPSNPAIYLRRGWIHQSLNQSENALKDYDQAIRIKPDYAEAYFNRGLLLGLTEKPQDAIPDLKKAADFFKQNKDDENYRSAIELIQELQQKPSSVSHS